LTSAFILALNVSEKKKSRYWWPREQRGQNFSIAMSL